MNMKLEYDTYKQFRDRYGPWAVVTGASSGIGRELASGLADRGLNLVVAARNTDALSQLATELTMTRNVACRVVGVDLARDTGIGALSEATHDVDVGLLVASAGFGTSGLFLESDLDAELEMMNVNCRSLMALSRHFGARLARRRRGGMILMSSIVGFQGMPNAAHYAATKAYVQTLAEAISLEMAPQGVDIIAAAPGPVRSAFAERAGMLMGGASNPSDLVVPILDSLGKKTTVLPGMRAKLLVYSIATLPRWARIRLMGQVMAGMTKHRLASRPG
jgi:short-subunit dehydrogenase